jgi:glycosyltransferase involved in cell wall biosynthesis
LGRILFLILAIPIIGFVKLRYNAKLLHANDTTMFRPMYLIAKILRKKVLVTIRDTKPSKQRYTGLHWRWMKDDCVSVITLSSSMADELSRRIGIERTRITVISSLVAAPTGIMGAHQKRDLRRALGVPINKFIVLVIGAFREKKGQLRLLRYIASNKESMGAYRYIMLGDCNPSENPYAQACLELIKKEELGQFVSIKNHQNDMDQWYSAGNVVLITSTHEGLARAMIEGLANGLPVISFDVASAEENLTAGKCGFVCKQGDFAEIDRRLNELSKDEILYAILSENARSRIAEMSRHEKITESYIRMYQKNL